MKEEEDDCTLDLLGFIPIPLATDLESSPRGSSAPPGTRHTEAESHDNFGLIYFAREDRHRVPRDARGHRREDDIEDGEYFDLDDFDTSSDGLPEHPDENEELTDIEFHGTPLVRSRRELRVLADGERAGRE